MLYVRNGHVVYEPVSLADHYASREPLTPREVTLARAEAAARWAVIVELMRTGQRLTGYGKVVPIDS